MKTTLDLLRHLHGIRPDMEAGIRLHGDSLFVVMADRAARIFHSFELEDADFARSPADLAAEVVARLGERSAVRTAPVAEPWPEET